MNNQVLASKKGKLKLITVPLPQLQSNEVLIETHYSAISVGTESTIRKTTNSKSILKAATKKANLIKKFGIKKSLKTFR